MGNFDDIPVLKSAPPRAVGNFDDIPSGRKMGPRSKSFAYAGIPGLVMTEDRPEDLLPVAGQAIGDLGGYPGAVAGATAGEVGRQGVRSLRGEGFSLPQVGKTAAATATMEGVFRGAGKLAKPITNKLMIAAVKPSKEALKKMPNWGSEAAERGIWGTLNGMKGKAVRYLDELEPKLQAALSKSPNKIKTQDVLNEFSEMEREALNANDETMITALDNVQTAIKNQGPEMSLEQANQLKRDFYSRLKKSQWGKGQAEIPALADSRKTGAYALRKNIDLAEPSVAPINKTTGIAAETLEGASKQQQKAWYKPLIPLVEAGGVVGGIATGNPWLSAAIVGRRLANSPLALSSAAQTARLLGKKSVGTPLTIGASEMARRAMRS